MTDTAPAAPYTGIVTESAAQYHQEITLRYAHRPPTNEDVARMVEMLRRVADDLARSLPKPAPATPAAGPGEATPRPWRVNKYGSIGGGPLGTEPLYGVDRRFGDHSANAALIVQAVNEWDGGWQPIETAPKDGTLVDLWCEHPEHGGSRATDMNWDNGSWRDGLGLRLNLGWTATHWRPLPKQPGQPEGAP